MTGYVRTFLLAAGLLSAAIVSASAAEVAMKGPEILADLKGARRLAGRRAGGGTPRRSRKKIGRGRME